jgi:serine/threonine protein kinase/tetratricopeptide (TPR) repeat protein
VFPTTGDESPLSEDSTETVFAPPPGFADVETRFMDPLTLPDGMADAGGFPVVGGRRAGTPGPLIAGQQFGARYHIIRQVGVGGMGAVYQAWDEELGVAVALKVIRPEVTRDPFLAQGIERRFKQELLLARQVTHKNVVRIHDLGELNGIKYITMPYIKGSDLATVLRNERLPVPKVMALARQIAAGLQAAHEAGVVHRDLKPANIMMDGDQAIIMDFGIAHSALRLGPTAPPPAPNTVANATVVSAADAELTRIAATVIGEVIGTIEFMAPEQARGDHVDQRADVYAFGLILYDVLAGRRRSESAATAVDELQKRLTAPPPSVRSIVPGVPPALDQVITRCTEPDAAKRFQTTTELVAALDQLDDTGELRPVKRAIRLPYAIAAAVVLLALSGYIWWTMRPAPTPENVSMLIADLRNNTNDSSFDGTLEPMMKRALEGASFITAFDRDGIRRQLGAQPPEQLDETAARQIAIKQGLGVVLAASIDSSGSGYQITVAATQAVTGETITSNRARAASKDRVLDVMTRLVTRVRTALGDQASSSAQMFAMASLSATSLDVVAEWVAGRDAASRNNYKEAFQRYSKAVELDPKFGLGYAGLANVSANLTNLADADKYIKEALRHITSMTERERYTTRGGYYRLSGDYRQCVKEYSELLATYPADVAARNNLAICLANIREFAKAFDQLKQVVALIPNRALYRVNLASFANFSSDFRTAEAEARKITEPDVNALTALAFAQLGLGQLAEAAQTYESVRKVSDYGKSLGTSGLADLANVEGRFSDAARILEQGAAEDLGFKRPDWAAAKLAALGHTELRRGRPRAAIAAAEKALKNDDRLNIRFMAARAFVEAGDIERARALVTDMDSKILAEPGAYAKIVEGGIELKSGNPLQAIDLLMQANALLDTWLGHFELGRAYLAAEQFAQADSEFERCLKRRGEALQLILGDEPTYAHVPAVYYLQARVREGMKVEGATDSYADYLKFRGSSTEDPYVSDIRARLGR